MALVTFLDAVQSFCHPHPRCQARSDPGDSSSPFQATSNTISVLLVPSVIAAMVTPSGAFGGDVIVDGESGKMPPVSRFPWDPAEMTGYGCPVVRFVPLGPMLPT